MATQPESVGDGVVGGHSVRGQPRHRFRVGVGHDLRTISCEAAGVPDQHSPRISFGWARRTPVRSRVVSRPPAALSESRSTQTNANTGAAAGAGVPEHGALPPNVCADHMASGVGRSYRSPEGKTGWWGSAAEQPGAKQEHACQQRMRRHGKRYCPPAA